VTAGGLPVISGRQLVRWLESLGYRITRQRGSHVRLERWLPTGTHALTVPIHREMARGTLNDILNAVGRAIGQDKNSLIQDLRRF
jgi:predicted RNA binding protein YcfA (HicA-like mRNA interferase family)